MAGHSKWANIKHKKAAADAKKGKAFSKIARELTTCARQGGGDPAANIGLRVLLQKARQVNMPADNIERAIKKGTGELKEDVIMEEIVYEGYAPGGVAMVVETVTDNRNRTASEVRHAFTKAGASLSQQGSVVRSFNRKGLITVPAEDQDEDTLMMLALEHGAEELERDGDMFTITTEPNDYAQVVDALNQNEIPVENSEVTLLPETTMDIDNAGKAKSLMNFVEALENLDDVESVHSNFNVPDEVLAQLEEE